MKILVAISLFLSTSLASGQSLKVMTYNLRFDTPSDGVNQWSNRIQKVNALIAKHDPDVIGVQEALKHQIEDILKELPQYTFVGVGRDDGKEKGEYSAILYKKDRLELLSQKTIWRSETPEVAGSKSWDAAITRILTIVKFRDKTSNKEFYHWNTHFDHIGKEARRNSALLIQKLIKTEKIANHKIPLILTGDFNSEPSESPYKVLISNEEITLYDTKPANSTMGTFCGFEVGGMTCKIIDYIFHNSFCKARNYVVIQDNDGKHYPSDHLPVMVDIEFK